MRDEHSAPPAAGLVAVAGLETWLEMSDRDPIAPPRVTGGAVRARWFLAAGLAAQHAAQDDALACLQVVAVIEQLPDHLVPGDERRGDERRAVERRRAGQCRGARPPGRGPWRPWSVPRGIGARSGSTPAQGSSCGAAGTVLYHVADYAAGRPRL